MTPPTPIPSPAAVAPAAPARPPLLARLKLTEPVRLYLYTVLTVTDGGLVLAGAMTGEWRDYLATAAALLLAVPAGAEAARASVYSPRSVVQAVRRAADR